MHGDLASITPPITVPAWACAMTGKTPGQLGLYGFRNRKDNTYDGLSIATSATRSTSPRSGTSSASGHGSLLIGVPPGFPPRRSGLAVAASYPAEREAVRVPGRAQARSRRSSADPAVHLRHPELPRAGLSSSWTRCSR